MGWVFLVHVRAEVVESGNKMYRFILDTLVD